ncbi:zf-HC2 domain-containing protein [Demequina soli]|uniref:zf-HC2 domain-containing protein n=1 Tax=Demequina soli TaxID=1638987 RepID=UPI00078355C4|nr:zf-HC2 domain-containing protein [Demequina soli]
MTVDHAAYADWDAAYVLGSLTPADRRAFEAHLAGCPACRDAVASLAVVPGLLGRARPLLGDDAAKASPEPPEDLVARVGRRRASRRRTVRRRIVTGALAVAAAAALAVGVPAALDSPGPPPVAVAMTPVADTGMTASLTLEAADWGTRIAMTCGYPAGTTDYGAAAYALEVTGTDGAVSQVATWTGVPGRTVHVDAATALPIDEIASARIVTAAGDPVLESPVAG